MDNFRLIQTNHEQKLSLLSFLECVSKIILKKMIYQERKVLNIEVTFKVKLHLEKLPSLKC